MTIGVVRGMKAVSRTVFPELAYLLSWPYTYGMNLSISATARLVFDELNEGQWALFTCE